MTNSGLLDLVKYVRLHDCFIIIAPEQTIDMEFILLTRHPVVLLVCLR